METTEQLANSETGHAQSWLEKIEFIRQRFPVGYRQARALLEQAGGDLVEALALLEDEEEPGEEPGSLSRSGRGPTPASPRGSGQRVMRGLQQLWQDSTTTRIRVDRKDHQLLDIPLVVGLAMGVFAPTLTLLAGLSALAADCRLTVGKGSSRPTAARQMAQLARV
ncbi:MAG: DUF4342 domain-containing protein [Limnochordaceae bacterium]|nr:DUF4342 domain-containing protein [Limnochordaceae bacterium]